MDDCASGSDGLYDDVDVDVDVGVNVDVDVEHGRATSDDGIQCHRFRIIMTFTCQLFATQPEFSSSRCRT
jgi:hypothetical protein